MGARLSRAFVCSLRPSPSFKDDYTIDQYYDFGSFGYGISCRKSDLIFENRIARSINTRDLRRQEIKVLENQEKIYKCLDHENIIKFYTSYVARNVRVLVFEMAHGKDLMRFMSEKSRYTSIEARRYMSQIMCAIDYCHSQDIIHRSLTPERFIMVESTSTIKLLDVCTATKVGRLRKCRLPDDVGDRKYKAPELIRREPYGKPVDVWSCGVIFFMFISGTYPFPEAIEQFDAIPMEGQEIPDDDWRQALDQGMNLVMEMLNANQDVRITARNVLQHPFFLGEIHDFDNNLIPLRLYRFSNAGLRNEPNTDENGEATAYDVVRSQLNSEGQVYRRRCSAPAVARVRRRSSADIGPSESFASLAMRRPSCKPLVEE